MIVPGSGGTLAWEVVISTDRPADWVIRIDAGDGSVIERFNEIDRATASARIFDPNAVVQNDGYGGLRDGHDKNTSKLTKLREAVTLENLADGQDLPQGRVRQRQARQQGKEGLPGLARLDQGQAQVATPSRR